MCKLFTTSFVDVAAFTLTLQLTASSRACDNYDIDESVDRQVHMLSAQDSLALTYGENKLS